MIASVGEAGVETEMGELASQSACPVCDESRCSIRESMPLKKDVLGGRLLIATCDACGAVFQPLRPTNEQLAQWYQYMGEHERNFTLTPLVERRLERLVRRFATARKTNRLLEIGCGGGLLLQIANRLGWDTYGTEISPSLCARLRPTMGKRLWEGDFREAGFAKHSFDVVAMIEVIEHLTEPLAYVVAARELLRPGGLLFLTTPNYGGISSRVLADRWRAVGDEHLNYFDPSSICRLLRRAGFEDASVATTNVDLATFKELVGRVRPRRSAGSPTPPNTNSASPPDSRGRRTRPRTALWAIDGAIEGVNHVLSVMRIGDTMKVTARAREGAA